MSAVGQKSGCRGLIAAQSVKLTASAGVSLQFARVLVNVLTIPMLLTTFGTVGLGVWMLALSIAGLINVVNSGLSITLVTLVARAKSEETNEQINRLASAATVIAMATAILSAALLLPVVLVLNWGTLLGLDEGITGEDVQRMILALVLLTSFAMIVAVPRQIMLGRLHGYIANASDLIGLIIGTVALIVSLNAEAPLWVLAVLFLGPPPLCTLLVGLAYLNKSQLTLFSWRMLRRDTLSKIGLDSLRMVGYQASFAISSQSDTFLTGIFLGPAASAVYGVAQRIFTFPILLAFIVNQAQWPYFARLDAEERLRELCRYFLKTLLLISLAGLLSGVFLYLIYDTLLEIWLGQALETDNFLLLGMLVWVVVAASVNTLDSLLRARNETKFLMRAMMAMCVVNLSVTINLLPKIGPAGAVWGTVCGYVLCLFVPYCLRLYSVLAAANEAAAKDAEL